MKFGWDARDEATRRNPYTVLMDAGLAELQGVPPALVIAVKYDPLKEAGVPVTSTRYNGTIHDFAPLNALRGHAFTQAVISQACDAMNQRFQG